MRNDPILVTGMPRSGNTWTARLLATARGMALPGREPMNPKSGQFALASTLQGWTRLERLSTTQRLALRSSYLGLNPLTYSKYGRHRARALRPGTRIVVKDPFAMLSIPIIQDTTGATTVVVYRHPGACLTSYRRMGWSPDLDELVSALSMHRDLLQRQEPRLAQVPDVATLGEAEQMAYFWAMLHAIVVDDVQQGRAEQVVIVSHEDLASGGLSAAAHLLRALGAVPSEDTASEMRPSDPGLTAPEETAPEKGDDIHVFDRDPAVVARSWLGKIDGDDVARIDRITFDVMRRLDDLRLVLHSNRAA